MAARDHALAELPEHMATGDIQAIFANLKRHVGVVALIYRHLATFPGALEGAWRIMGPMFESGVIHARAARVRNAVHDDPALRWSAFQAALRDQFGPEDLAGIGHVLDAYNRANPTNILGVLVLARVSLERRQKLAPRRRPLANSPQHRCRGILNCRPFGPLRISIAISLRRSPAFQAAA